MSLPVVVTDGEAPLEHEEQETPEAWVIIEATHKTVPIVTMTEKSVTIQTEGELPRKYAAPRPLDYFARGSMGSFKNGVLEVVIPWDTGESPGRRTGR